MLEKKYFIYIMASTSGTLYIGITNNLKRRIWEHKNNLEKGFSRKYKCHKLIYFEEFSDVQDALAREKQLKKWRRDKKETLIKRINFNLVASQISCHVKPYFFFLPNWALDILIIFSRFLFTQSGRGKVVA